MKCVVDTNVLAYYLLRTDPFFDETRAFWRNAEEAWAPDSWRAEFLNVLWLACRAGALDAIQAEKTLFLAERLVTKTVSSRQFANSALHLAMVHQHPAYATLFVALAMREDVPLVTWDRGLLTKFPNRAMRPSDVK